MRESDHQRGDAPTIRAFLSVAGARDTEAFRQRLDRLRAASLPYGATTALRSAESEYLAALRFARVVARSAERWQRLSARAKGRVIEQLNEHLVEYPAGGVEVRYRLDRRAGMVLERDADPPPRGAFHLVALAAARLVEKVSRDEVKVGRCDECRGYTFWTRRRGRSLKLCDDCYGPRHLEQMKAANKTARDEDRRRNG